MEGGLLQLIDSFAPCKHKKQHALQNNFLPDTKHMLIELINSCLIKEDFFEWGVWSRHSMPDSKCFLSDSSATCAGLKGEQLFPTPTPQKESGFSLTGRNSPQPLLGLAA